MALNKLNVNNINLFINKINIKSLINTFPIRTHFTYVPDAKITVQGRNHFMNVF